MAKAVSSSGYSGASSPRPRRHNLGWIVSWVLTTLLAFHLGRTMNSNVYCGSSRMASGVSILESNGVRLGSALQPQKRRRQQSVTTQSNDKDDGWHCVDVFYGNITHLHRTPPTKPFKGPTPNAIQDWYSQAGQDEIVMKLLKGKTHGYFIDLAANDARKLSNTFALERRFNWTGLCIEPNPEYWWHLAYRNCHVVGAVVGRHRMEEVQFRFETGVLGGIVNENFDVKPEKDQKNFGEDSPPTLRYTVPLLEIFERYNTPSDIDYLSLDVEGAEEYIMALFPLDRYNIKIMTVERPNDNLQAFLKANGFEYLQHMTRWGETLWAHRSVLDELDLSDLRLAKTKT